MRKDLCDCVGSVSGEFRAEWDVQGSLTGILRFAGMLLVVVAVEGRCDVGGICVRSASSLTLGSFRNRRALSRDGCRIRICTLAPED